MHVYFPIAENDSIRILTVVDESYQRTEYSSVVTFAPCVACGGLIATLSEVRVVHSGRPGDKPQRYEKLEELLFPRVKPSIHVPQEVPEAVAADYGEAVQVLPISPKASAALSRRILQRILNERFGLSDKSLFLEIQKFQQEHRPPTYLSEQLDAVRNIGNFAAHPLPDKATGEITDVEPGEAEWLIQTLEMMFDFAYVQPAKAAANKKALNEKLRAAGKPELP